MKQNKHNLLGISGHMGSGKNTVASIIQYLIWKDKIEKGEKSLSNFTLDNFRSNVTLANNLSDFKQKSFAHKLKEVISIFTNIPIVDLEKEEIKNKELGEEWWYYTNVDLDNIITLSEFDVLDDNRRMYFKLIKPTPRLLMQNIGTDCFRNMIHSNIHIIGLFSDYPKDNVEEKIINWLITDVRFKNELKSIEDRNGITIRVNRCSNQPLKLKNRQSVSEFACRLLVKEFLTTNHSSETELDEIENWDYEINNDGTIEDLIEKVQNILIKENLINENTKNFTRNN